MEKLLERLFYVAFSFPYQYYSYYLHLMNILFRLIEAASDTKSASYARDVEDQAWELIVISELKLLKKF